MKIEVKENVFWDNESKIQSDEAYNWISEIRNELAFRKDTVDKIQPEYDKFDRPVKWTINNDTYVVEITRDYINKDTPSWALNTEKINIYDREV